MTFSLWHLIEVKILPSLYCCLCLFPSQQTVLVITLSGLGIPKALLK